MKYIYWVLNYMAWFWFMEWLILVYIINRVIHGCLEMWNFSSTVHIRYLTRSLPSLVQYLCEHSKINSISPCIHVLFSLYYYCNNIGDKINYYLILAWNFSVTLYFTCEITVLSWKLILECQNCIQVWKYYRLWA